MTRVRVRTSLLRACMCALVPWTTQKSIMALPTFASICFSLELRTDQRMNTRNISPAMGGLGTQQPQRTQHFSTSMWRIRLWKALWSFSQSSLSVLPSVKTAQIAKSKQLTLNSRKMFHQNWEEFIKLKSLIWQMIQVPSVGSRLETSKVSTKRQKKTRRN